VGRKGRLKLFFLERTYKCRAELNGFGDGDFRKLG
jgi:hypothetical protein